MGRRRKPLAGFGALGMMFLLSAFKQFLALGLLLLLARDMFRESLFVMLPGFYTHKVITLSVLQFDSHPYLKMGLLPIEWVIFRAKAY
jgi:hypothetical protein